MLYETTCAILWKGDRVVAGTTIEMSAEEAARLGGNVVPAGQTTEAAPAAEVVEKALGDMSKAELEEAAAARGITTSGTKADLIERIQLHDAAPDEEETDEE